MKLDRRRLALLALVPIVAALLAAGYLFAWNYLLPIHATLHARDLGDVRVSESVSVTFDKPIDRSTVHVTAVILGGRGKSAPTPVKISWSGQRVTVRPVAGWMPGQRYRLELAGTVENSVHAQTLRNWHATFRSQPVVAVTAFAVDGKPARSGAWIGLHSTLQVQFSQPMAPESLTVLLDGGPAPRPAWSDGNRVATIRPGALNPFVHVSLSVAKSGFSQRGDPVTGGGATSYQTLGLEPSNWTSRISPGFKTQEPILITIENSPAARPQSGFQAADIVYEYVSEYSITRMTAIYFNQPPRGDIGPVRSCRTINLFLPWAYSGVGLCSGASSGTEHLLFQRPYAPDLQDPFAPQYFFRVGFNVIPHNLYTNGILAARARRQWPQPPGPYQVDPPHPDNNLGTPAPAPRVPLHGVVYAYDSRSRQYLRFDDGAPFIDASTGHQLHVKNVILIHVPFHILGYVEDEYGGALSVWYSMLGSGPAQIYSDGTLIQATWHMGRSHERWSDNHDPVYFTDAHGNFIELNTGLTWIHVLGNGQTH